MESQQSVSKLSTESVCTSITSGLMGLVGIFSPNFSGQVMNFGPQTKKVTARILIHPNCSYTVSWRKSICQVVLFGVIRQLPLLREEFRIPKLTFHSDLRRRAASRRALPCPSSFDLLWPAGDFICFNCLTVTFWIRNRSHLATDLAALQKILRFGRVSEYSLTSA